MRNVMLARGPCWHECHFGIPNRHAISCQHDTWLVNRPSRIAIFGNLACSTQFVVKDGFSSGYKEQDS